MKINKVAVFLVFVIIILLFLIPHFTKSAHPKQESQHQTKPNRPIYNPNIARADTRKAIPQEPVQDINRNSKIDTYLKSIHFNGTAMVVKDGKIVIDKGYGYRDFTNHLPNNSNTVFYLASISKIFVSTAIMQLQEQNKLNIHDKVSKYIPDFPNGNRITLYELLTHTSGIPEHAETAAKISHDDLIKKIEKGKLRFKPGTRWLYSDSNYSILAYILEKVTNDTLQHYVQTNIFNVAGMKHTGFGDQFYQEKYQSIGYKKKNNKLISPGLPDMSELFGCGDIYSTPYDMYKFDKALYTGKLLSPLSLRQVFTPRFHHYGLGIYHDPGSYSDHGVLPGYNLLNSFGLRGTKYVVLFSNIQNGVKSLGVVNNQIFMMLNETAE
ncbi:serine hydrolase domain-containing protein [Heyndrickxia acidicola]|uniref:Serine hydrolase n=1 Tax=Heyndrickxia acidicola TaxID=209389 RepID=A0ABU6MJ40_9BACI|nr:serine hydrolase domain-containing protein [Heyndrickxia acidicola]MED1204427.1 serine hydrolase [Heyndrickxia acidicola]